VDIDVRALVLGTENNDRLVRYIDSR
jgi:hypothetical protein